MIGDMISERSAKLYCSEDISLIENYHIAIADKDRMWEIHHRRECDDEGRTLFTKKQLIDINVYYNRPASELMFVTRSMHMKIHRENMANAGKIGGKSPLGIEKRSIPVIQFTKDLAFIKEWISAKDEQRQLGIGQQHICACCKGQQKTAGCYIWRYKDSR